MKKVYMKEVVAIAASFKYLIFKLSGRPRVGDLLSYLNNKKILQQFCDVPKTLLAVD